MPDIDHPAQVAQTSGHTVHPRLAVRIGRIGQDRITDRDREVLGSLEKLGELLATTTASSALPAETRRLVAELRTSVKIAQYAVANTEPQSPEGIATRTAVASFSSGIGGLMRFICGDHLPARPMHPKPDDG